MKRIIVALILIGIGVIGWAFAQTSGNINGDCTTQNYQIEWPESIKVGIEAKYHIFPYLNSDFLKDLKWEVKISGEKVQEFSGISEIRLVPQQIGGGSIQAVISGDNCQKLISKKIFVYKDIYLYIWESLSPKLKGLLKTYNQNWIYFHYIFLPSNSSFSFDVTSILKNNFYYLKNASKVIIFHPSAFLQVLEWLQYFNLENAFGNKNVYLVYEGNPNIVKWFIGIYVKKLNIQKMYLVPKENMFNLLVDIDSPQVSRLLQPFGQEDFRKSPFRIVSLAIDNLLFKGFPFYLLALLFAITLGALVIAVFRQIIWFWVYGVYTPLLFAISVYFIGWKVALFFLFVGVLSKILINAFNSRVYLLYSAKISLYLTLYFLLFIISLWWLSHFGILKDNSWVSFRQEYVIFPMVFIGMTADKIFTENSKLFSLKWVKNMIEFLFVGGILVVLISSKTIQYFLISYPELILVMIAVNIAVGRFTGLQLLEYRRFLLFIKKHMEEEE